MATLPLSNDNVFNDFLKTYAVLLHPDDNQGRRDFLSRQFSIMRLNCVSEANVQQYASLSGLSQEDAAGDRLHRLAGKVGFFSGVLLPHLSRVDPYFNRYVLKALPTASEHGSIENAENADHLSYSLFWERFKNVAHLYVALPYLVVAKARSNMAVYKNKSRRLPFRLDLGLLDLNRFKEYLFIAEYIRGLAESTLVGRDGRPLMDKSRTWKVPAGYAYGLE